jgi:hypothetical protein
VGEGVFSLERVDPDVGGAIKVDRFMFASEDLSVRRRRD